MAEKKQRDNGPRRITKAPKGIGGREFGNVIEPTQAEMASGNKGLASQERPSAKATKKPARKKAA